MCFFIYITYFTNRLFTRSEDEFGDGYTLLNRLCSRAEMESLIPMASKDVNHLWTMKDKKWRLSDKVKNKSYRVGLSLLKAGWPGISEKDIIDETGVARSTVRDHISVL